MRAVVDPKSACFWLALLVSLVPALAAPPSHPAPQVAPSPVRSAADDTDVQPDGADADASHAARRPAPRDPELVEQTGAGNFVRDDAQVLPANVTATLTRKIRALSGKADIFICTKLLDDMSLFDQASQATFRDILREVNHYRVIVIFIAYNRDRDHGIISTNLGHGIWHIVSKQDCEQLFGKEDAALTVEGIQSGVNRLVHIIKAYYENQPGSAAAPSFTGGDNLAHRLPFIAVGVIILGAALYFRKRGSKCPVCGAALKTRVSISLAGGASGRIAKKTFKCFRCGYSHRQSLIPTGGTEGPRRAPRKPEDDEAVATANEFGGLENAASDENQRPADEE
jgi:hypothetical protein